MDLASITQTVFGVVMIIFTVIVVGVIGIFLYMKYKDHKRYEFLCVIFGKDGFGQLTYIKDVAGIYVDNKTGNKRFFLKKHNVGLNTDTIPYIKDEKGGKIVFLKQFGLKNFKFINFEDLFKTPGEITVGEEDVNWALNSYERAKKVFGESMLQKLLPYMGIILMGVFVLGIVAIALGRLPEILGLLKEVIVMLKEVIQIQRGTTIIN